MTAKPIEAQPTAEATSEAIAELREAMHLAAMVLKHLSTTGAGPTSDLCLAVGESLNKESIGTITTPLSVKLRNCAQRGINLLWSLQDDSEKVDSQTSVLLCDTGVELCAALEKFPEVKVPSASPRDVIRVAFIQDGEEVHAGEIDLAYHSALCCAELATKRSRGEVLEDALRAYCVKLGLPVPDGEADREERATA